MSDWKDDPTVRAFLDHAQQHLRPMIEETKASITVMDDPDHFTAEMAIEIGFLILMDKPILILKPVRARIPLKLRQCATMIINYDPEVDIDQQPDVERKLAAFMAEHP
jgi:hypothetical protein